MVSTQEFKRLQQQRDELVKKVAELEEKLLNYEKEDETQCYNSPIVENDIE